jgi:hypothetical protein
MDLLRNKSMRACARCTPGRNMRSSRSPRTNRAGALPVNVDHVPPISVAITAFRTMDQEATRAVSHLHLRVSTEDPLDAQGDLVLLPVLLDS